MVPSFATLLLCSISAATPPASPLETPPKERAELSGFTRVVQVTGARAYLDAGSDDGLMVGQVLVLRRGEVEAARCIVEAVSANHATCTGGLPRPGDTARLHAPATPEVKVVTLPPLPGDDELARRAAQVAAVPVTLVEAKAKPVTTRPLEAPRGGIGEFTFSDVSWWSSGLGAYHTDRVDAALHGAPVGPFTADVDLRAEYWSSQPVGAVFLPADKARLQVWQAQLTWAPPARSFSVSAGRVLAWNVPGATSMDGASVSWRRGGFTGGFLGGLVPQPDTTSPTTTRATAGAFWGWEGKLGTGLLVRQEGRLALVRSPELGDRVELQAGGSAHAGAWFDLFADARFGFGGKVHSPAGLDGARVEAAVRPVARLSLSGAFDYGELLMPQTFTPLAWPGRSRHADGNLSWDFGLLRAGVSAGNARDLVSGLDRAWAGPELSVPRLFTPRVSLSAGFQQETGWLSGRSAWLQAVARPWDPVRIIARASWGHQSNLGLDQDEFGLYLSGSAELTRHLGVRLSVLARTAVDVSGGGSSVPLGFNALASIYSLY
jgi:hypothetical protein